MQIQKGDLLNIQHTRKGFFKAVATRDFDTDEEEFYPVVVAPSTYVRGVSSNIFPPGCDIPCKRSLVKMILIEEVLEKGED